MEKILIIHNEYQQKGGEDVAVSKEIEILSKNFRDLFIIIVYITSYSP